MRIKHHQEIICGINLIETVLTARHDSVETLYILDSKLNSRIKRISSKAKSKGVNISLETKNFFALYCKDSNHQGLALLCDKRKEEDESLLEELLKKESLLFLVLDHITDPHNVGACLRNAAAANVDAVIVPKNRSCHLNSTVRKISSGGSELVPFIVVTNLVRSLKKMQSSGVQIIGAEKTAKESYTNLNFDKKSALVIGSEDKGLRTLTTENCDKLVKIDMPGQMESLNASVASGILLFEFIRKS